MHTDGSFGFSEQRLHPRLSKSLCFGIHHSDKRLKLEALDLTYVATAKRDLFVAWFNAQPPPSWVGVPREGQIGGFDGDDHDDHGDGGDAPHDDSHFSGKRDRSRQQKQHDRKLEKIQENHFELLEFCKFNRTPADDYLSAQEFILGQWRNRKRAAKPGHPTFDRIRGVADRRKGESVTRKKRKVGDAADSVNPVLQLRERIRKNGLSSGTYVQIANDDRELWFMRVVNGNVVV